MGTSTTGRGTMEIPGEAEADWIFNAGLVSITPVRWPEYTLPSPSLLVSFLSLVPKGHLHELLHHCFSRKACEINFFMKFHWNFIKEKEKKKQGLCCPWCCRRAGSVRGGLSKEN
jgi:hypothetical protein